MKTKVQILEKVRRSVEEMGLFVGNEQNCFTAMNKDLVFPFIVVILCTRGSLRGLYDMKEMTIGRNDLGIVMPQHIMRLIDKTEDYAYVWLVISPQMLDEIWSTHYSRESCRFDDKPMCRLTDEQAERVVMMLDQLSYIAGFTEERLPRRSWMLKSQIMVCHELLSLYREEQDKDWAGKNRAMLYSRFCDMVVQHYTHERNVNYYAEQLGYEPRYFSKLFRTISNGVSPMDWIGHYVATQAKHIMNTHPRQSIKETAYQLGFPNTANFCRYFKRVTGITPKEYREGEVWNEEE